MHGVDIDQNNNPYLLQLTGTQGQPRLVVRNNGEVGIGTSNPGAKLEINGGPSWTDVNWNKAIKIGNANAIQFTSSPTFFGLGASSSGNALYFFTANGEDNTATREYRMIIKSDGNIGIGTTTPDYDLDVCGTIRSYEWIVETFTCDFVFEDTYKRMSFEEKEKWFKEKKHLPGIAPAVEIKQDGMKAGSTLSGIIMNVEENSLDIIDLYKQLQELKKENETLKQRIYKIENK
ncbi:MAG: hypothetical protein HY738_11240 [Bacteroidia bacterium]|nr:hypothetical protein [Bacteroidia bacterium]